MILKININFIWNLFLPKFDIERKTFCMFSVLILEENFIWIFQIFQLFPAPTDAFSPKDPSKWTCLLQTRRATSATAHSPLVILAFCIWLLQTLSQPSKTAFFKKDHLSNPTEQFKNNRLSKPIDIFSLTIIRPKLLQKKIVYWMRFI